MSLSYKKYGVIGGELNGDVTRQLQKRSEVVGKRTTRTAEDIAYLTSVTGWCKVTSAVDVDLTNTNKQLKDKTQKPEYSNKPALDNQLFGGVYSATDGIRRGFDQGDSNTFTQNSSYSISEYQGIVPMAGITSFQVTSQGSYGTLRAGSFNFTVHSTEDFNKFEQLYLRPGFQVLMEWGHSSYIDNSGELNVSTEYYSPSKFGRGLSECIIRDDLFKIRRSNFYNYDFLYGFIKNFAWSYNGSSYECQVDVISKGEVISSIANTFTPVKEKKNEDEESQKQETSEIVIVLNALKNAAAPASYRGKVNVEDVKEAVKNSFIEKLTKKTRGEYVNLFTNSEFLVANLTGKRSYDSNNISKYITLRDFFKILNKIGLYKTQNSECPLVEFYTGENLTDIKQFIEEEIQQPTSPAFTTFEEHIAIDPYICVLPGKENKDFSYLLSAQAKNLEADDILNIYVNVDYLLDRYEILNDKDKENNNLKALVSGVLSGIQENLGGINSFAIHYEEDYSKYFIVDKNVIPSEQDFDKDSNNKHVKSYIDLVGLGNEITNLNIASKLTGALTTMISIAAQAGSTGSDVEILNMQKWNYGLRDRHLVKKTVGTEDKTGGKGDTGESTNEEFKEYQTAVENLKKFIKKTNTPNNPILINLPKKEFEDAKLNHRTVTSQIVKRITENKGKNPPGMIPFELSFTMKGISGMRIGQSFKINEFFLPDRYKGSVAFLITGLDHKVQNNQWTTDVKTQLVFI